MATVEFMWKEGAYHRRRFCEDLVQETALTDISHCCKNTDLYRSVFTYKDEKLEEIYGPLYFDLDTHNLKEDFELIRRETIFIVTWLEDHFNTDVITISFTGAKGFHIMFDMGLGFMPAEDLVNKYKTIAFILGDIWRHKDFIDTAIYDKRRVIRVENTINGKTGLYKIPVLKEELRDISYESLMIMAEHPRDICRSPFQVAGENVIRGWHFLMQPSDPKYKVKKKDKTKQPEVQFNSGDLLPCISAILSSSVEEGRRNNTAHLLSNALLQKGYSYEDMVATVTEWNENNSPPLDSKELNNITNSAKAMFEKGHRYGCEKIKTLNLCLHCRVDRR